MSFTPDLPSTEDVLAAVLSSSTPPLPPQESLMGDTTVSWWETTPGEVYIHAEGGTADDRHYASTLTAIQLEGHGYRRAQFSMDPPTVRVAAWDDLMAKAKRLLQSGQVHVLRNGFNYIIGHVVGDHGEYDTEVSRDDPNSRAITSWQCSCPWDQYAWQRTRKWKKFEGRPCSHVLALYWKALSTPMDEQLTPEQAEAMGTGQKLPAPPVAEHPPEIQKDIMQGEKHQDHIEGPDTHNFGLPRSFSPEGDIIQGDQLDMATGQPGPAQAPMAPPPPEGPVPPGVLPPFPGEQMQMQWQGPGTTPGGGVSPPGAYTVPGAKPQSPANPIQNPSTYSRVAADFNAPEVVKLKNDVVGLAQGPVPGQYGDGEYREVPALKPNGQPQLAEVVHQDPTTGWIECLIQLEQSGEHEPYHVRAYLEPGDIEKTDQTNAFIRRHR